MTKLLTKLTYLACALGFVSLGRAIAIEVGSSVDGGQSIMRIGLLCLAWGAILLLPILVAAWIAYLSQTAVTLALAPALLMAWILVWTNGSGLMLWHSVRSSRPHGMSFSFELSLLGIFFVWPATVACLVIWGFARRRIKRRSTGAAQQRTGAAPAAESEQQPGR